MKILHIAPSYWPAFKMGGPTQSVHLLNRFLVKKGADITVFTTNAGLEEKINADLGKEKLTDGVKVFYFPYYGYVHYTFSPRMFIALRRNIKKFDLVHITGVWNFPVFAAAFWARFYKIPYVISPRGSLMKEPLTKKSAFWKKIYLSLMGKRDLKNAVFIHFTAESEKKEYVESGLPMKKSVVIPNGFDADVLKLEEKTAKPKDFRLKFGIRPNYKIVLFLSRISWKKGLDTLIPAFADAHKEYPRSVLVIAGGDDEGYKKEIIKIIELSGLIYKDFDSISINQLNRHKSASCDIIFTGMLTGKDKSSAFKASNVFVLPSYSENFGMAVVEAMYYKLLVIVTEGVAISDEIRKFGIGLVVKKNIVDLKNSILSVLSGGANAKMEIKAKNFVEKEYSAVKVAEKMYEEYYKING